MVLVATTLLGVAGPVAADDLFLTDQGIQAIDPGAWPACGRGGHIYAAATEPPSFGRLDLPSDPVRTNSMVCLVTFKYVVPGEVEIKFPLDLELWFACPGGEPGLPGIQMDLGVYLDFGEVNHGATFEMEPGTLCAAGKGVDHVMGTLKPYNGVNETLLSAGREFWLQVNLHKSTASRLTEIGILLGPETPSRFGEPGLTIRAPAELELPEDSFLVRKDGSTVHVEWLDQAQGSRVEWDFGDGTRSTLPRTSHTYATTGSYELTASVYTPDGWAEHAQVLQISANPGIQLVALDISPLLATIAAAVAVALARATAMALRAGRGLSFIPVPAWGLFTRIAKPDLLQHPARQRIHDIIAEEPGIHFQDLVRASGQANGAVTHHVAMLLGGGLIADVKTPGSRCFYNPEDVDRSKVLVLATLRSPRARAALQHIADEPGISIATLVERTGFTRKAVRVAVESLEARGLVSGRFVRNRTAFHATSDASYHLDRL